ncbi:MAG: hypothetical protein GWP10_09725 [Nitrospiraceae bacterium]|nr:hypothetical protein [Nitrospiraceae bacterium]
MISAIMNNLAGLGLMSVAGALGIAILLVILVVSILSRPRVFCEYLKAMTGIELKPAAVRRRFNQRGRAGVRDLLIDLLIQEDLADPDRIVTPDSEPDLSVFKDNA